MILQRLAFLPTAILIVFAFFYAELHAYPLMNYPGTRAKAMGMAYTAIADDASAIWYNPAGLAIGTGENQSGVDFIVEVNDVITILRDETKSKPFFALKFTGEKGAFGMSYFVPYAYGVRIIDPEGRGNATMNIRDTYIISIGGAYTFPHRIRLGATLEMVELYISGDPRSGYNGLSGSLGAHWIPVEHLPWGLKIQTGGAYRFKSDFSGKEIEFANKPASWNVGLSVMKSITSLRSNLIVSSQFEKTDLTAIDKRFKEYDMISYGMEWQIALDGKIDRMALRAGMYSESAKNSTLKMEGKTFGFGLRHQGGLGFEYTLELREWNSSTMVSKKDYTLHAFALTYNYQW